LVFVAEISLDFQIRNEESIVIDQSGLQNEYGVDDEFMVTRFSNRALAQTLVRYSPE
jgi:hypothetical protein